MNNVKIFQIVFLILLNISFLYAICLDNKTVIYNNTICEEDFSFFPDDSYEDIGKTTTNYVWVILGFGSSLVIFLIVLWIKLLTS